MKKQIYVVFTLITGMILGLIAFQNCSDSKSSPASTAGGGAVECQNPPCNTASIPVLAPGTSPGPVLLFYMTQDEFDNDTPENFDLTAEVGYDYEEDEIRMRIRNGSSTMKVCIESDVIGPEQTDENGNTSSFMNNTLGQCTDFANYDPRLDYSPGDLWVPFSNRLPESGDGDWESIDGREFVFTDQFNRNSGKPPFVLNGHSYLIHGLYNYYFFVDGNVYGPYVSRINAEYVNP